MKAARRHELQQNLLADWLAVKLRAVRPYATALGIAILVLVIAWFAWSYYSSSTQSAAAEAWDRYLRVNLSSTDTQKALQDVADSSPKSTAAVFAELNMAVAELSQGNRLLLTEREEANRRIDLAIKRFQKVLQSPTLSDPMMEQFAKFHLARAYEARLQLENAREQYEALVKAWPDAAYATAAQRRLDDLARQETVEFYTWFREARAETPGLKSPPPSPSPDFRPESDDISTLPVGPDKKADQPSGKPTENKASDAPLLNPPSKSPPSTTPESKEPVVKDSAAKDSAAKEKGGEPKPSDAKASDAKSGDAKPGEVKTPPSKAAEPKTDGKG